MSKENNVIVNGEEEVVKPKRASRAKAKKTGQQIVDEIGALTHEVAELVTAADEVDPQSVLYPIAQNLLKEKQAQLDELLTHQFTV